MKNLKFIILLSVVLVSYFLCFTINCNKINNNYIKLILEDKKIQIQKNNNEIDNNDINNITNQIKLSYDKNYRIKNKNGKYLNVYDLLNISNEYGSIYNIYYCYNSEKVGIIEFNVNNIDNNMILGNIPTNENEIMITNYIADLIIKRNIKDNDKIITFNKYEDIINSYIMFNNNEVKITGILMYDLSEYNSLKNIDSNEMTDYDRKKHDILIQKSQFIYNKIYVHSNYIDKFKDELVIDGLIFNVNNKNDVDNILNKFSNSKEYSIVTSYSYDLNNMLYVTRVLSIILLFIGIISFILFIYKFNKSILNKKEISIIFIIAFIISFTSLHFLIPYIKSTIYKNGIYELLNPMSFNYIYYILYNLFVFFIIILFKYIKKTSF